MNQQNGNEKKKLVALIIDTETTGMQEPVLPVEIAWRGFGDKLRSSVLCEFSELYNPGKPMETGAMATHGIIESDLEGKPDSTTFQLPDGIKYLIGHNIDYDWKVIGSPDIKRICTLALARRLYPDADSHKLTALLFQFLQPEDARELLADAHGAAHDVSLTEMLLNNLLGMMPKINSWERLWEASERARVPVKMPMGKHRGVAIADLPKDYVQWCLTKMENMDPYLRQALEKAHA